MHDTLEDTYYDILTLRDEFGEAIAQLVEWVTETKNPWMDWHQRKSAYLGQIRHAPPPARLICLADKIHNLTTIIEGYKKEGEGVWRYFYVRKDIMHFFQAVYDLLKEDQSLTPLIEEYGALLETARQTFGGWNERTFILPLLPRQTHPQR